MEQTQRLDYNGLMETAQGMRQELTDTQATIAALQAEVKELEEITKVICGHCCEPMEIPSKAVLQSQLAQRTVELEAANKLIYKKNCELGRAETINNDLQAELERVRGELMQADNMLATQRVELLDLRTLILALPKVEGEITANRVCTIMMHGMYCEEFTKLLQHRQGMEGV